MRVSKLSVEELAAGLPSVPDWTIDLGGMLRRTFVFSGFLDAVGFVNQVAEAAERADHHPDIDIRWNKVILALTTHDSGGLTEKDFALAQEADGLFKI
jgi:4a-hydroxytetrahydrobiopterin dehydratase